MLHDVKKKKRLSKHDDGKRSIKPARATGLVKTKAQIPDDESGGLTDLLSHPILVQ